MPSKEQVGTEGYWNWGSTRSQEARARWSSREALNTWDSSQEGWRRKFQQKE